MMRLLSTAREAMRRIFWTAVVLLGAVGIVAGLWIGVPFLLFQIGIGAKYDISLLRWGVAEYSRSLDITPEAFEDATFHRRWQAGYAFARRGDTLEVDARGAPGRGSATLIIEGVLGTYQQAFKQRFRAGDGDSTAVADSGPAQVVVPGTGLYTVRYQMTDFLGDLGLRWRVR